MAAALRSRQVQISDEEAGEARGGVGVGRMECCTVEPRSPFQLSSHVSPNTTPPPPASPSLPAAMFVDAVDLQNHAISKSEFRDLIMHMAAADLHTRRREHAAANDGGDWAMSSWEQDEEIVDKLK